VLAAIPLGRLGAAQASDRRHSNGLFGCLEGRLTYKAKRARLSSSRSNLPCMEPISFDPDFGAKTLILLAFRVISFGFVCA